LRTRVVRPKWRAHERRVAPAQRSDIRDAIGERLIELGGRQVAMILMAPREPLCNAST
jgi:hypothetical protein